MNEIIEFKKERELGTILTDVFKFIRLNWRLFFSLILKIAGPALILLVAVYVFYMNSVFSGFNFQAQPGNMEALTSMGAMVFLYLFLLLAVALLFYTLLNGVVLHFIKSYIYNHGIVNPEEVKNGVWKDFWSLLGLGFLVSLVVGFGFMLCIVPGIYFGVVLSTTYAIVVFNEKSALDAFTYSFSLIKDNWWITFATLLVIVMLYYFIALIFQVPQYIYFFIKGFSMTQTVSADITSMFDWVAITLSSISFIFQYLLHSVIIICIAFIYFNLNEKKHHTGTYESIDSIGDIDS